MTHIRYRDTLILLFYMQHGYFFTNYWIFFFVPVHLYSQNLYIYLYSQFINLNLQANEPLKFINFCQPGVKLQNIIHINYIKYRRSLTKKFMMMPMGHRIKINQCFYIINSNIQPSKPMPLLSQNILILIPLILLILVQTVNANKIEYTYFIFTPTCYHSLIQSFNFRDTQCIKLTASKLLGYLLVAGGGIVKLPQVIKILLNKSVYGISFTSILMQSFANWVAIVYSWHKLSPFSIYGENVFLLIQNMIIMSLFIVYGKNVPKGVEKPSSNIIRKYASIFVGFLALMFLTQNPNLWPQVLINYVLILQMVLFSSARLTQIFLIFSQKSTGNLALATCVLVLIGNLGRLFTVLIQISGDYLFVFSVLLASVLNGIIVFQFILYWSNTAKQQKLKQT